MAEVARLLPRLWDGQRALRFLTGLAMLALAFAANAGLIGSPATPVRVSAAASVSPAVSSVSPASASGPSASASVVTGAGDEAPAPAIADVVVPVLLVVALVVTGALLLGAGRLGWRLPARRGPPLG
ncbi:hypothetical protein [Actinoplanes sp. NPDC049265]|uniref:hypothetical protein n=1 Tax=Actinoplanes sp. NPDC049265 TaxID=3363902 RepID=UPI003722AB8A